MFSKLSADEGSVGVGRIDKNQYDSSPLLKKPMNMSINDDDLHTISNNLKKKKKQQQLRVRNEMMNDRDILDDDANGNDHIINDKEDVDIDDNASDISEDQYPITEQSERTRLVWNQYWRSWSDSTLVPSRPLCILLCTLYFIIGLSAYVMPYVGLGDHFAFFFGIDPSYPLIRHSGLFLLQMSLLNLLAAARMSRSISLVTGVLDVAAFIHYCIETFWHRALYLSVMVPLMSLVFLQAINTVMLRRKSRALKRVKAANVEQQISNDRLYSESEIKEE